MTVLLSLKNGEAFATGRARYADQHGAAPAAVKPNPKVYVRFVPGDWDEGPITAALDTGSDFTFLDTEVAEELGLLGEESGIEASIQTPGGLYAGHLVRIRIRILADEGEGESLDLEDCEVFVSPEWKGGSYIGYGGVLQFIRMALDPQVNHFYFGGY